MEGLVTSQIDALALLGNANCQLLQRRREMLKPFLNKKYAALCSTQTAITSLLFGKELQNQLASICASNRISDMAVQSCSFAQSWPPQRTWPSKLNDRDNSVFYKGPNPRWPYRNRNLSYTCQVAEIRKIVPRFAASQSPIIRMPSQVYGYVISSFPGVMFGLLFFQNLERDKTHSLQHNVGNFDATVFLSASSISTSCHGGQQMAQTATM